MCGICGFNWKDEALIKNMSDQLIHRGPDQHGVFCCAEASLGFRRLSIIDLSHNGNQPMFNEDGSVCLVFNGEIYNFQELRADLENKGHIFSSQAALRKIGRVAAPEIVGADLRYAEVGPKFDRLHDLDLPQSLERSHLW